MLKNHHKKNTEREMENPWKLVIFAQQLVLDIILHRNTQTHSSSTIITTANLNYIHNWRWNVKLQQIVLYLFILDLEFTNATRNEFDNNNNNKQQNIFQTATTTTQINSKWKFLFSDDQIQWIGLPYHFVS